MMTRIRKLPIHCMVLIVLGLVSSARGVIVAGLGNATNNSEASLAAHLAGSSLPAFPYWNNLVRVADASGIFLGTNAISGKGWVMSANHVTTPTSITVAGISYSVTGSSQIGSSDIKLYEIGGGVMPPLLTVPIASATALAGSTLLMTGRGFSNSSSDPYPWGVPGTSDANGMRWGTNVLEGSANINLGSLLDPYIQRYLVTDFDAPGPGVDAYEAQAALGDSGGGMFIYRSGQWQLSGIAHFVDDGPDFMESTPTGDNVVNPSQYGDFSAYSDLFTRRVEIANVTGVLVPESSGVVLALLGGILCLRRKR